MESSPSGPLICTVDIDCTRDPLSFAEGAITLKVTPWGIESGADPILDWHDVVLVKVLCCDGLENAGKRKVGIASEDGIGAFTRLRAHRCRTGANIFVPMLSTASARISGIRSFVLTQPIS